MYALKVASLIFTIVDPIDFTYFCDVLFVVLIFYQWPLLLTWFNFNPSMDKQLHAQNSVWWNYLSIPKLQRLHRWSLGMDK